MPGLKAHLYNDQGKLRSFVNVYVNDEDIRYLQKEQTPVNAGRHGQHHPVGRGGRIGAVSGTFSGQCDSGNGSRHCRH